MNEQQRQRKIQELNVAIIAAEEAMERSMFKKETEELKAEIDRLNNEYQKLVWGH